MEDELDQEGLEDEGGEPSGSSGGGSPMKMIIIGVVLVVVAAVAVWGFILPMFFGEPTDEEKVEEVQDTDRFEYGVEYRLDPITYTMQDESKSRNKSMVVDVTFETSNGGVAILMLRQGLIETVVETEIKKFDFTQLPLTVTRDSIGSRVTAELNTYIKDVGNHIKRTYVKIVTQ